MSNIDNAHGEIKESPSTTELLASLFKGSRESQIRRVKEKTRPKSATRMGGAPIRTMKDAQQQIPVNHRGRQMWFSGSKIEARVIKKKTHVRKPAVSGRMLVKGRRIKAQAQEKPQKSVAEKRSVYAIRQNRERGVSQSRIVKRERSAVSEGYIHPTEVSNYSQRRSIFGSTTLGIGLPFVMGVLLAFLGTRLTPLYLFDGDQAIALAKNEMVENPVPVKQDVAIPMTSEAAVETAKLDNENKSPEPPPIGLEKGAIEGLIPKESDTSVSETPKKTIAPAKQAVSPSDPELSQSTHSDEAAKTETFQRDEIQSYPYSIYLGSYKNINRTEEAISIFKKKGLSPYWVRVDLGEKGVWYRVLAGYFHTKDEVNAFIEKNQITEGRSRYVLYANLIGLFSSDEELREKKLSLVELGYCPYVIEGDDGESLLYSGAFYYKEDAEKEHIELASKGIQSRLAKR
ncbi:MAG: SPOR domain-containing protein [Deltaproteobacteria bacterium]|nr:SPOR domain-containing protein [Deltaproteobacteria bacterium]